MVFRERFSFALQSLNSILKYRNYPFLLHYHDSDSPPSIRRELEEARDNGELRLFNAGLGTPNQIRNWALSEVSTKYVCFIDNDVLVTDGWIETLVSTAERTEAGIVFPLYLMGELASNPDVNANFWALLLLRACVVVSKSVALFRLIMVEAN